MSGNSRTNVSEQGLDLLGIRPSQQRHQSHPESTDDINQIGQHGYGNTVPFTVAFTSEELSTDPEDAEYIYRFTHSYPGLLVLIVNSQFHYEGNRDYGQKDIENMQRVFEGIGFEIRLIQNKTTEELVRDLKDVTTENIMQHVDCLACVISSHGSEEMIVKNQRDDHLPDDVTVYEHFISTKNGKVRTRYILEMFDDDHCRHLTGKPRIFFIQACRTRVNLLETESRRKAFDEGTLIDIVGSDVNVQRQQYSNLSSQRPRYVSRMDSSGSMPKNLITRGGIQYYEHTTPDLPDKIILAPPVCLNHYLVMFSSVSEQVGWSDDRGGWLLVTLHDVFQRKIREKQRFNLLSALHEVTGEMSMRLSTAENVQFSGMKSVPCMEYKLTKDIFFEPVLTQML